MMKKKLEVVELNKEEEKIVVQENPSNWKKFWTKYNILILLILLILSLTFLTTGIIMTISNLSTSDELVIKKVSIDTDLDVTTSDVTASPNTPLTDETAKNIFQNNTVFKSNGVALLVKTVSKKKYTIEFYSDYTAIKIMKNSNLVTRINSINGEKYGIKENGVTNADAEISDVKIDHIKEYPWGIVTYYSDGSAKVSDSDIEIFVRNAQDIQKEFITNNKVSYLKETKKIKNIKLNYYHDGTIEVNKQNKSYIVRNENDLNITDSGVTFKYNNQAEIIKTIHLKKGQKVYYYSDGGAIIRDGSQTISVRKSNSIIIKDDNIYEIVDNIYVEICKVSNNGNITYYTNGSAVIKNYNGKTVYGYISSIGSNYEVLTEERNTMPDKVLVFETVSVVTTKDYIAIVPKNNVIYDTDGSLKEIITGDIDTEDKPIKITNNTNEVIKYRLVLEKSNRTTLDVQYIKYQLSTQNKYIEPTKLNNQIWKTDVISNSLSVTGINYILTEGTLLPTETDEIRLMLWTDYETIPNSMQNKYFYGTLRIYAWQEIEVNV